MDVVPTLRDFNRSYTKRIGVLDDSYLGLGRPLGLSRLLFEIEPTGTRIRQLRSRLGLDSGYLSRQLGTLKNDGLITVKRDPIDGRHRLVSLTAKGKRERAKLDRHSEQFAQSLVAGLGNRQREKLAAALDSAERILRAAEVEFVVVDPASDEAQWAMGQYFGELDQRFRDGFDPGDGGAGSDVANMAPPRGSFVMARWGSETVGCGGLVELDDDVSAEIKRMWIHADWRGLGLASRLLADLEGRASSSGRNRVVLDTNEVLLEAVTMYGKAGYEPIERYNDNPYAHHWFAKQLGPAVTG